MRTLLPPLHLLAFAGLCIAAEHTAFAQLVRPQGSPMVDVSRVVEDFLTNYEDASRKYSTSTFALKGRVEKITERKHPDATHIVVHFAAHVVPDDADVRLWVVFSGDLAKQAAKLKPGDLIESEIDYMPVPPGPVIHEIRDFSAETLTLIATSKEIQTLHDQMVAWVQKNNALKPNADGTPNSLEKDARQKILAATNQGHDFRLTFGKRLVRSGMVTMLCAQDGKMVLLEFSPDQSKDMQIADGSLVFSKTDYRARRGAAEVRISSAAIDGGEKWNLAKPLAATIRLKRLVPPAAQAVYGARIVTYRSGERITLVYWPPAPLEGDTLNATFEASPAELERLALKEEPSLRPVFLEVIRKLPDAQKDQRQYEVVSDPIGLSFFMSAK